MLGAIIGDIVGSPYEFDKNNIKTKEFPMFTERSRFTDDTVMTLAVAEGLMNSYGDPDRTKAEVVRSMQRLGRLYPYVGYGARFSTWLISDSPEPYGSYGNGSAMRVSAAGWLYDDMDSVLRCARDSAWVTHNHPEGIKWAEAVAEAILLARKGTDKDGIRRRMQTDFGCALDRTCDQIRPGYHHDVSCGGTVPEAIEAFLEGVSFEDVIRTAVSLGGDCDTLTAIAGSIAEGCFPIPPWMEKEALDRLDDRLREIYFRFKDFMESKGR